jgi:hypothetical protein
MEVGGYSQRRRHDKERSVNTSQGKQEALTGYSRQVIESPLEYCR